ncbi:UrcA family protein [Sandarakinorhabdus sp.]|uniref:UrcA family protein n=1 Tax=Sandarakinorhabdus sp. TaxID=1916663 RepID=UPI003567CB76
MFASPLSFSRNLVGAAGTLFFASLCIAGATTPAGARTAYGISETGHKVAYVSTADLNLGSPAGREALEARLRIASRNVCHGTAVGPWVQTEENKCFANTLEATRNSTMAAIAADKVTS